MVSTPQDRKRLIQGVIVVGAGLAVPQVLAYAASVIAARLLVPAEFGAFGAMQGITQIGTPIGLAIQAIAARRLVKNSANKHHDLLKFGLEVSIAVMLATLLISFPLSSIFKIDYLVLVLTIGAIAPFVFISTQLGIAERICADMSISDTDRDSIVLMLQKMPEMEHTPKTIVAGVVCSVLGGQIAKVSAASGVSSVSIRKIVEKFKSTAV
jgi:hypothetical protein